ncbi:hypothetical protein NEPAR06_0005 [Nematocida parisii]|uniref:Uncharacterized protein n=1 Tax=Nematocida parisii (strain ERTm3) TaxID=935791 RepID=I3EE01_NEMP3|nr:uncharacterized protein NEPG_00050 [Nematocida parisii ERTm1]EIJ87448.1 hypothetical protein NEQG_02329 [Nematocida parisii ERTm3]KAI5127048.1 hypothetical protein NEPAR08_0720 [Nematocida parisii]KAI5166181.1 hypothetical protein NEIRO02_1026 [Nematocida sp. AWRm79]KAI5183121.1 hypothetical protein NEIRO03_0743 [Nematocida sp. AWRm78]OAG30785.1 hypothetical protein NEIG_00269 [Nematocida sp. ERTm5]|eukprot:XP_013057884.1 hypothetical protein NEPG_00050 [Nematocida parisii ERTm1]
MSIAIKIPKTLKKGNITIIKYKDGRILLKSDTASYKVMEFPLEFPKYVINKDGKTLSKIRNRGIIKRSINEKSFGH